MGIFQKLFGGSNKKGGKMEELLQALSTDLHLNNEQTQQLKAAFRNFRQERKQIKSAGGDRAEIQQARQQLKERVTSILNDEQKQIFTANAARYDSILHGSQNS